MLALSLSMGACGPKPTTASTTPTTVPSNEAMGDEQTMPADECVDWDATNECIGGAGDSQAPADECIDWNAADECIQWQSEMGD